MYKRHAHYAANEPRGEYVLVMAGAPAAEPTELTLDEAAQRALELTRQGFGPSAAAKAAAQGTPYSKSEIYKQQMCIRDRLDTVWSTLLDTLTMVLFISVPSENFISSRL